MSPARFENAIQQASGRRPTPYTARPTGIGSHCGVSIKINIRAAVKHNKVAGLLVSSIYATHFGRTAHLQAFTHMPLQLKIKCIYICILFYLYIYIICKLSQTVQAILIFTYH
jgi:uncharacterized membrane protein YhdT